MATSNESFVDALVQLLLRDGEDAVTLILAQTLGRSADETIELICGPLSIEDTLALARVHAELGEEALTHELIHEILRQSSPALHPSVTALHGRVPAAA